MMLLLIERNSPVRSCVQGSIFSDHDIKTEYVRWFLFSSLSSVTIAECPNVMTAHMYGVRVVQSNLLPMQDKKRMADNVRVLYAR